MVIDEVAAAVRPCEAGVVYIQTHRFVEENPLAPVIIRDALLHTFATGRNWRPLRIEEQPDGPFTPRWVAVESIAGPMDLREVMAGIGKKLNGHCRRIVPA